MPIANKKTGRDLKQVHVCAACLFSNKQWEHSNQRGVVRVLTRSHARTRVHVRTLAYEDSKLVSTTTGINLSANPPYPLRSSLSKPTHTFMPLVPLLLIVPHAPCKGSIETQSVFLLQPRHAAV